MRYITVFSIFVCIVLAGNAELFAQERENVEQIGQIYNYWIDAHDAFIVGDLAFVAAGTTGLQVVDVSDPENPAAVGHWDGNIGSAEGIVVSGDYAYLVDGTGGLYVINIGDPANPEEEGHMDLQGTRGLTISGDFAYISRGSRGMSIVNISNPENLIWFGHINSLGSASRVVVSGDIAYIVERRILNGQGSIGGGLRIVDISDPENPEEIGYYDESIGGISDVSVSGDYAYVVDRDLITIDISDPENMHEVDRYDTVGSASEVEVMGDYAFVAEDYYDWHLNQWFPSGFSVFSIRRPGRPIMTGYCETYLDFHSSMTISGDHAFISHPYVGLYIFNIADPRRPRGVGNYKAGGEITDIAVSGDYAYVAKGRKGFGVVTIHDPEFPVEIGSIETEGPIVSVIVSGDYAYLYVNAPFNRDNYLLFLDISNPDNPQEIGRFICAPKYMAASGDFLIIARGRAGIFILDLTDIENPDVPGLYNTDGEALGVAISGDYVYVADKSEGLRVISIADPENLVEVGHVDTPEDAVGVTVVGEYAYVSVNTIGQYVVDISDPENPIRVGRNNIQVNSNRLQVSGNYACFVDAEGIVRVLDISNRINPVEVGYSSTPGLAHIVAWSEDGLICVADDTNMGIYRFTDPTAVNDPDSSIPDKFLLSAAYPNPFNSTTTITYGLPHTGNVSLKLYDPLGQQIRTLFEGNRQAGIYAFNLFGGNLASGMYLVKLSSGDRSLCQKIILTK